MSQATRGKEQTSFDKGFAGNSSDQTTQELVEKYKMNPETWKES